MLPPPLLSILPFIIFLLCPISPSASPPSPSASPPSASQLSPTASQLSPSSTLHRPVIPSASPLPPLLRSLQTLDCPPGEGPVQDLVTNPCSCIESGTYTGRPGCDSHSDGIDFCHTTLQCLTANEAPAKPETTWRPCDPTIDNDFAYFCSPCEPGFYESSSTCLQCPADTYNPTAGSTDISRCQSCPLSLPSSPAGSASSSSCRPPLTCFTVILVDSAKDGWSGNELAVTNDETNEITLAHIGSTFNTGETQIETHCVEGCGCWTAKAGGGSYTNEVGWSFQMVGADEVIAKGGLNIKEEEGKFCGGVCSTSCPIGSQPNAHDDGCDVCPVNFYSATAGIEWCDSCSVNAGANWGTNAEESTKLSDCVGCRAGYYMQGGQNGTCAECPLNTFNPDANATNVAQCLPCAQGQNSERGSTICSSPLPSSEVRQAVEDAQNGGAVFWASGTGVLEQTWSDPNGWEILKALIFTCTSLVEKCVIDALAHFSDPRVVLRIKHGGEIYSSFVGLVVRGGYVSGGYGIGMYVEDGSRVNLNYCEIVSNKGYSGGGLYVDNSDDNSGGYCIVNIRATVFANNTATNLGADIYAYKGEVTILGSTFYPVATKTNIYSSSATIKFQGSDCEAGEEGTTNPNYVPTFEGDPAYLEGHPASYTGCRDCEPGRYSDAPYAELCSQCDAGTYTDQFKTTACSGCKMGTYMSSLGAATCANCDFGKYSTTLAANNHFVCTACPIGKSAPEASSSCACAPPFAALDASTCACTAGFSFDGSACERCDNGFFKSITSNEPCTACEVALKGSLSTRSGDLPTSPSSCICGSGEVQVGKACEPCPEGGVCDELGLTLEVMPLLPSYWRTSNSSADILKCYNEAACTPPTNSTDVCALNHVGPFCEMCAEGFALATGACVSCKDGKAGSLVVCVMVLFLLCAVGWCVYSIKDREEVGAAVGAGGLFVKRFKLPAKLLLQYFQIISMLEVALNLEFPPLMSGFANGASASNLDAFAIVPTGCAFTMNTHDKLLMFSITIVATGTVVGAWSAIKKKSRFKTYLIGLSFILPTVTRLIFTTFPCVEVDTGESWLVADKNVSCDDEAHESMIVYAYFMFLIICVGLPGGCFVLLLVNRAKINPPNVSEDEALRLREADESLDYIRFLFRSYRPAYWYWEVLEMIRRIFMTGGLVVLARGSLEQIVVCVVVSVVTLKAVGSSRPYLRLKREDGEVDAIAPDNNDVAEVMMWQTISTLLLCVLVKGGREAEGGALGEKALDGMMVASQFMFVVLLFKKRLAKRCTGGREGKLATVLPIGCAGGETGSKDATIARLEREKRAVEEELENFKKNK